MKSGDKYKVIGVMSGTSLDGMDLACCTFSFRKGWKFEIVSAVTMRYSPAWKRALATAHQLSGNELMALDAAYGRLIGKNCAAFIRKNKLTNIDAVASHGHTIFHQTDKLLTFQMGNGNAVYAQIHIPVIYDFRGLDVALQGQGAPLVPVGDHYLFGDFDICVNLGGIGNLSLEQKGKRIAFDFCYANMGLNYLAGKINLPMDKDGRLASAGTINDPLLKALRRIYERSTRTRPALGREGFERDVAPVLDNESISLNDRLCTVCHSVGEALASAIPRGKGRVMVTGGGVMNSFLMNTIRAHVPHREILVPPRAIVEFKEALVFAFLGVLRMRGEVNVWKSVTRASSDSCSGAMLGG